ncbi:MAG TPA: PQQ-binding-like beta-propeller repeat protein, partial [Verrucomicrobiota bacterium]|nr:PQQ-binding-like beta-propeller repeat protein [Verrucomicrobiota bacterium]
MLGRNAAHHGRLPDPLPALTAPAGLTATDDATNSQVVLRWDPVPGAAWYEVSRAPQPDLAAALPLATNIVRTTEHADAATPPDVPFWYWVRAAGVDGPGPWSGPVRGLQGSRLWQATLPFTAFPTPAVAADGTAYVLVRGQQSKVTLMALAREDGSELWRAEVGQALTGVPFAAPPVLTEDGRIIVSGQQALACFSSSGERLWEQEGSRCLAVGPMALTRSGLLVMTTSGSLLARRITDGEILWDLTFNPSSHLSPVVGPDGTIWVCRSLGGMMALRPDGTIKILSLPVNPSGQPAMSLSGELLVTDQSSQLRVIGPEGSGISFGARLRAMGHPVSPAPGQVGFALRATPTELILGTTATQVVARLPGGWSAGAEFLALAQAADGTWYVADPGQVRALRPDGQTAAVWPVLNRAPGGLVIGDDGTLYVQQLRHLSAFR